MIILQCISVSDDYIISVSYDHIISVHLYHYISVPIDLVLFNKQIKGNGVNSNKLSCAISSQ